VVNDFVEGFEDAVYSQVEHIVAVEAGHHAAEVGGIIEPQRALDGGVEASSITFLSNALPNSIVAWPLISAAPLPLTFPSTETLPLFAHRRPQTGFNGKIPVSGFFRLLRHG
jgi:hypothetical protein